jgi:hypothetical protein
MNLDEVEMVTGSSFQAILKFEVRNDQCCPLQEAMGSVKLSQQGSYLSISLKSHCPIKVKFQVKLKLKLN